MISIKIMQYSVSLILSNNDILYDDSMVASLRKNAV